MLSKLLKAITMVSLCVSFIVPNISFAGTASASTQAKATLSAVCTISAQNLSFGNLVLPISAQTASSSMSVLCSKNANYTVGLAYGGVYGTTSTQTIAHEYQSCVGFGDPPPECYYYTTTTTTYNYGKMLGVAKGDYIGYSIQVPNQPSEVWNAGNYSYSSTGTGVSQSIPVVGTLVPSQSGSKYPIPDSYMDTVTATINF